MRKFSEVWDPVATGLGVTRQEIDDERFRSIAASKGIYFRDPKETLADFVILVGIELYEFQLEALDLAVHHLTVPLSMIQLFNLSGHSKAEWDQLVPGIGSVPISPLVAVYKQSTWIHKSLGLEAMDLLRSGLANLPSVARFI